MVEAMKLAMLPMKKVSARRLLLARRCREARDGQNSRSVFPK